MVPEGWKIFSDLCKHDGMQKGDDGEENCSSYLD